jgi:type IV secretory pathway protease TraF
MNTKKILVVSVVFFGLINSVFFLFQQSHWRLVYEQQSVLRCLPIEFNLTHLQKMTSEDVERGMLVSVQTKRFEKFYKKGINILKLVVGLPGDEIEILGDKVFINGSVIAYLPPGQHFKPFTKGKYRLKDGEYWLTGTTPVSLDSRYVGPFALQDMIGKSYALI